MPPRLHIFHQPLHVLVDGDPLFWIKARDHLLGPPFLPGLSGSDPLYVKNLPQPAKVLVVNSR